jgi:hypothetical protein
MPSLKARTTLYLILVVVIDVLAEYGILLQPDFSVAAQTEAFRMAVSSAISVAIAIVLTGLLSAAGKARLVFWRWRDPLPGSRAFSEHARADPRIDLAALRRLHGTLPRGPDEQNRLWYQIYLAHQDAPAVADTHLRFLFCREGASVSVVLLAFVIVALIWIRPVASIALSAAGVMIVQYLLFALAARTYGIRLVCSVLAQETGKAKR